MYPRQKVSELINQYYSKISPLQFNDIISQEERQTQRCDKIRNAQSPEEDGNQDQCSLTSFCSKTQKFDGWKTRFIHNTGITVRMEQLLLFSRKCLKCFEWNQFFHGDLQFQRNCIQNFQTRNWKLEIFFHFIFQIVRKFFFVRISQTRL